MAREKEIIPTDQHKEVIITLIMLPLKSLTLLIKSTAKAFNNPTAANAVPKACILSKISTENDLEKCQHMKDDICFCFSTRWMTILCLGPSFLFAAGLAPSSPLLGAPPAPRQLITGTEEDSNGRNSCCTITLAVSQAVKRLLALGGLKLAVVK
jgi:hypothetical protein